MSTRALIFRASSQTYAVPIADVIETMRSLPLAEILGAIPPVLGISIIRGVPTPVLDAGMLLGHTRASGGRLITLRVGVRAIALAVDEVIGVRTLPREDSHPMPPVTRSAGPALERIGILDGELLVVLHGTLIVPDAVLAALEVQR